MWSGCSHSLMDRMLAVAGRRAALGHLLGSLVSVRHGSDPSGPENGGLKCQRLPMLVQWRRSACTADAVKHVPVWTLLQLMAHLPAALLACNARQTTVQMHARGTTQDTEPRMQSLPMHCTHFPALLRSMLINMWPGFGGSLAAQTQGGPVTGARFYGIANTILCLAGSSIAAFAASSGLGNKLNMVHIQNSTLAGGVAISSACEMNLTPAGELCSALRMLA